MQAQAAGGPAPAGLSRRQATVAAGVGATIDAAAEDAFRLAGLADALADAYPGTAGAAGQVLIKPLLPPGVTTAETARYVDPLLVSSLSEWLRERGWSEVGIAVPGPGGLDTARAVGYTDPMSELSHDPRPFHFGRLIGDHEIARAWARADIRILVGRARPDRQLFYTGAIIGALGCLPATGQLAHPLAPAPGPPEAAHALLH